MKEILRKLKRIPTRLNEDIAVIRLVKNWKLVLSAKLNRKMVKSIELRNGSVLESPDAVDLYFLFQEIWIDKVYNPGGYEIKAGDTIIDIGGNIGMFAVFASSQESNVQVDSYEPFPSNAGYYLKNTQGNKLDKVRLHQKAVTGKPGNRFLHVSDAWGSHSLLGENMPEKTLEVQGITFNEILDQQSKCDFLKIDCEGSEYEIFYSATKENLNKIHKIACEYHDNSEGTGTELKKFLEDNSFRVDVFRKLDDIAGIICATNLNFGK